MKRPKYYVVTQHDTVTNIKMFIFIRYNRSYTCLRGAMVEYSPHNPRVEGSKPGCSVKLFYLFFYFLFFIFIIFFRFSSNNDFSPNIAPLAIKLLPQLLRGIMFDIRKKIYRWPLFTFVC